MKLSCRHPVFVGFCCLPALLLATCSLIEGVAVGTLLAVILLLLAIPASLLPHGKPAWHIAAAVLLPTIFAALAAFAVSTFVPWLSEGRAWLVPLSVMSLGAAGMLLDEEPIPFSDALAAATRAAARLFLTFILFSLCREVLTFGTVFAFPDGKGGFAIPLLSNAQRPFFASVAGALLLLALFAAVWNLIPQKKKTVETAETPVPAAEAFPEPAEENTEQTADEDTSPETESPRPEPEENISAPDEAMPEDAEMIPAEPAPVPEEPKDVSGSESSEDADFVLTEELLAELLPEPEPFRQPDEEVTKP